MSNVQLHPVFVAALFDQVGGYRETSYNGGALGFIKAGAKFGPAIADKLPLAIKKHMQFAEQLLATRADDSGYKTIHVACNLLLQAAVKRLHGQIRSELTAEQRRINAPRYTLQVGVSGELPTISADAWAEEEVTTEQAATAQELSQRDSIDEDHVAREMLDEEQWAEKQLNSHDLRDQVEALAELFAAPCLVADQIVNSWRATYGQVPALSYLRVPMANGTFRECETLDDALQTLVLMDDERAIQQRAATRVQVAQAGSSWA